MAAEYADDDDDKIAILDLKKVTLAEQKLHNSIMKVYALSSLMILSFLYAQSFLYFCDFST